jgi:ABC-type branched-subunit amino acid transport system substrate-binding protein
MTFLKFLKMLVLGVFVLAAGLLVVMMWRSTRKSAVTFTTITLHEAQKHALIALPQKPENDNLFYPDYSLWYRNQAPSWFDAFGKQVSFSPWNAANYKALFGAVIQQLQDKELCHQRIVQLAHQPGDKLIIIGDLQGSFDSCVRDLAELKQQGIIDDQLVITKPHYQLIFNSNVIGRDLLNLGLLVLVSSLILKNPNRVWYVRGAYEEPDWWQHSTLGQQLDSLKGDGLALKSLIMQMINFLPYAVYINYDQGKKLIRISGYGRDFLPLNERQCGTFFTTPFTGTHAFYCIDSKVAASPRPHVKATISSNDGVEEFVQNKGLALLDFAGGSVAWSVFSAPTKLQQTINDFHYDAFAVLELGATFEETAISLYSHDIKTHKPFELLERHVLQTAQPLKPDEKVVPRHNEIVLGTCLDLSKGNSSNGRALKAGLSVCINEYNRSTEGAKRPIELIIRNNEYSASLTRELVNEFHAEGTNMLIAVHGTPTLRAAMDFMENGSMLFLFPASGATIFRSANLPGVINLKASYREQTYALIPQLVEQRFVKRFAFLYQDDAFGLSAMEAAREILPAYGIKEWTEIPYVRNVTDMKIACEKLKQVQPEALGFFATATASIELLKELGIEVAVHMKLFGIDTLTENLFTRFAIKNGIHPLLSHSVPDPDNSMLPIVQEYRKAMESAGKLTGDFSLEGYISARLFIHAMQTMKGPINPTTVREFFEQIKHYDFKGLQLDFDPVTRSLCHDVWVGDGQSPLIKKTSPELEFRKKQFKP